jgi:hypothetical protein
MAKTKPRPRALARVPAGIGHNRPPISIDMPRIGRNMPDQVFSLKQWAELNALSLRTARRLVAEGDLPVLRLSGRRIGVRASDAAKWQAERMRGTAAAAE